MCEWLPLIVGLVKLNFHECFLYNLEQLGIGGVIKIHSGIVVRGDTIIDPSKYFIIREVILSLTESNHHGVDRTIILVLIPP